MGLDVGTRVSVPVWFGQRWGRPVCGRLPVFHEGRGWWGTREGPLIGAHRMQLRMILEKGIQHPLVLGIFELCFGLGKVSHCLNIKIDNFTSTESGNKVGVVFMFLGFHFIFLLISFLFYEIIGL